MSARDSKTNFSAGAFSMALFAVGVLLWGCGGSGCGGGNCPPVGCPTPKEGLGDNILGHVAYGDTPTSDTIVASVGSDGDIYFQLTGSDPSQGPNWTSWADYFKLHPFGLHDWDQAVITFYPDASQSCDTSTTNYYLQDNKLSLQVTWDESDVVWEAGEHDMVMTLDDPGTQSLIGLPGCYSVEDPDKTITVKVHLWDAKLDAPTSPLRGDDVTYEMKHDDLPTSYVLGYLWESDWGSGSYKFPENGTLTQSKTWDGVLVTTSTEVLCGMRVQPPFMTAFNVFRSTETLITRRNWNLPAPQSADEDYRTDWEAILPNGSLRYPTLNNITCDSNRNVPAMYTSQIFDKNGGDRSYLFNPNPFDWTAVFQKTPYTIILTGPNTGLSFIQAADFQYDLGTVINKWMRDGGPNPGNSTTNWFDENTTHGGFSDGFGDTASFIAAVKSHEMDGNTTGTDNLRNGHFAHLQDKADEPYYDVMYNVESLIEDSTTSLTTKLGELIVEMNDRLHYAGDLNHTYVKGNWLHTNGSEDWLFRGWHPNSNNANDSSGNGHWGNSSQPTCDCYRYSPDLIP